MVWDSPLCMSFPSLFAFSIDKEVWVANIWDPWLRGIGGLESMFYKSFNDWEVEKTERFLERIHGKKVLGDVEDMVFWIKTKSGKFFGQVSLPCSRSRLPFFVSFYCIWNVWVSLRLVSLCGKLCGAKP
ncbi:hypothetical protein CK203_053867 [Vitis vinifera]|uniref:Uncharacterized protein n=1 Tax=Vitis vinifera TaxID=29760 RepID=A0A438GRL5_VITVI|nr:hypothetical protein CK203_053867 [Vitis vinifera]